MKKLKEQLALQQDIKVPYHVWTLFGEKCKYISIAGNQASLGEDYQELDKIKKALEWYVDQCGGKITWKE